MKKWISYLSCAAFLTPAAVTAASPAFTGLYGGVNVGMIQAETRLDQWSQYEINLAQPVPLAIAIPWALGSPAKISDISPTGGLNVGFARSFNACLNWGVEIRANFMGLHNAFDESLVGLAGGNSFLTRHTSVKLTQQYAAIAKIAYAFKCDAQAYVFLGPQWGNFQLKSYMNSGTELPVVGSISGSLKAEHKNYKAGWYVGVGYEELLNKCTSIGLEYNYSDYGTLNFNRVQSENGFIGSVLVPNIEQIKYLKVSMRTNTMLLKMNYYFC